KPVAQPAAVDTIDGRFPPRRGCSVRMRESAQQRHGSPTGGTGREPEAVRIGLLGGFGVSVGSRVIQEDQWPLRKASSLIKLLSLAEGHRLHREQAMELLWPDLDPRAAAHNIHHALHVARRTLEPSAQ